MMEMFKFYTWKDIDRYIRINRSVWLEKIQSISVYPNVFEVVCRTGCNEEQARLVLSTLFRDSFNNDQIYLYGEHGGLQIVFEDEVIETGKAVMRPLFKKAIYSESVYNVNHFKEKLSGVPVLAFHSYKGGVGRTLSLLALVKAWSELHPSAKLLVIDADLEAPGITWINDSSKDRFSYLDFLELLQGSETKELAIETVRRELHSKIVVNTKEGMIEHLFMPAYRYEEQLLDMYASPTSVAEAYDKEYWLSDATSMLGKTLGADAVVVDLRAGVSELSAPFLFDYRVDKYIVTSASGQSIYGTKMILGLLAKGMPIDENARLPQVFLNFTKDTNEADEYCAELATIFDQEGNLGASVDDIVVKLPFSSDLINLKGKDDIFDSLEGKKFYDIIKNIVRDSYIESKIPMGAVSEREKYINLIHERAVKQVTAESNDDLDVLQTRPIRSLLDDFRVQTPRAVIMGAKGSGKTFLYRELVRSQYWEKFQTRFEESYPMDDATMVIPLLSTLNGNNLLGSLNACVDNWNGIMSGCKYELACYENNFKQLADFGKEEHSVAEWLACLKQIMLPDNVGSLKILDEMLQAEGKRILFLIDGIEDLFQILYQGNKQGMMIALCNLLMIELNNKYKRVGCLVFVRNDIVQESLTTNFEQFRSIYGKYELVWSGTEALRLALWLVSKTVPDFYPEREIRIEQASDKVIRERLVSLWGRKLGPDNSKEAYTDRWVLAALSDLTGRLQARDIIRFLEFATESPGKETFKDRYLMPTEIRNAVPRCSTRKLEEIKQEIGELKPILQKFEGAKEDKKIPFRASDYNLTLEDIKVMQREGYLYVDDKRGLLNEPNCYMPEIIRYALDFRYSKGARPKVLSLMRK